MDIVIDFDGTCVSHEFPEIGKDIGAQRVLLELIKNGHNLILFTMRSGYHLEEAVQWFEKSKIPLYGIQKNPTQSTWTTSPKAYGALIIDDAALGCPLRFDSVVSNRPFVSWGAVRNRLIELKLIKNG